MRNYHDLPSGSVDKARTLRKNATDAEKRLWRALREKLPGTKWRRQVPHGPYVADFLCFAAKLIVEADGGQHAEQTEQDAIRTRYFERQGYRVLRFWNNDVLENTDGVIETIAAALKSLSSQEREGGAQRRKGEAATSVSQSTSPSHASHGPLPLLKGEG